MASITAKQRPYIVSWIAAWFTPRSKDRDARFRELTCRWIIAVMISLTLLAFLGTVFVFHDEWKPI
ncbi:MAG TPA: hypothetical protein VMT34_07855, partial [Aggregatilineales bacterium]|nr:hypothetical protein [Aggregatilineales bacterium]